jgi:transcriptional regulator with XRE-family HTH domain
MNLGEKLKSLRLRENKTLKEQSEIFKVSMNSVYRWEHNLAVPRMHILKQIADYYRVPMEWFFQDGNNSGNHNGNNEKPPQIDNSQIEQQLLTAFRKLSDKSKYKVLGYVERMVVEEYTPEDMENR